MTTSTTSAQRILIVRLGAIGDVILATPLLCALRDRFPNAFLAWAVEKTASVLLEGHESLDELIVLPKRWLKSPKGVWQLRRRLKAMNFDLVIDAQGLTKSAILARLSGVRRRIGFGDKWGREQSRWLNNELVYSTAPHVIDRTLQLLLPLDIESPKVSFRMPESQADIDAAESLIEQLSLGDGYGMINPGAGWPSKIWPAGRYAAVARHLGEKQDLPSLVVWAGDEEQAMARQIVNGSGGYAQLAPPTGLRLLGALARRGRMFIGSDTGPLHLAVAVGTPCVGLYGPWPSAQTGPYGPGNVVVEKMTLDGSTSQRRHASSKYMEAIDVESVCRACDRILRDDASRAA